MKKIITVLFKVMAGMILIPIIILTIWFILRLFACGPDREVVRVASPVAKIIADDILKNGIPKSLQDIKGFPYKLEGCEIQHQYLEDDYTYPIIKAPCYFNKNKKRYDVSLFFFLENSIVLSIFNGETRTGIEYYFDYSKETNKFVLAKEFDNNPKIYDSKKTGICFRWGH